MAGIQVERWVTYKHKLLIENVNCNFLRLDIIQTDMNECKEEVLKIVNKAFIRCSGIKEIAGQIKKDCELVYGKTWHCIIGKNFASDVSHGKSREIKD